MATVTVTEQIAAPTDTVFASFTDIDRVSRYVSGIKALEMLTPGDFRLGTRWRETREVLGRLDTAEMEVTSYEKPRAYTITHYKGGARIDTKFSFVPFGTGTKVTIAFELDNQGLPPGLLTPVGWAIAGKVRDVLTQDLADLKHSIEASA